MRNWWSGDSGAIPRIVPPMRILFVSGLTGYSAGGVQTEMVRLVGGLSDRGDDVAFAIDKLPGGLDGVRQFPLKYPPTAESASQVAAAVGEFKPDCVHVVGGGLNLLRPMDAMKLGVPWVFTAHNLPPFERISDWFPGHNRLHYWVRNARAIPTVLTWKRFLRSGTFARVIAHSETVARHLKDFGCPAGKIVAIPFGCQRGEQRRMGKGESGGGGDEGSLPQSVSPSPPLPLPHSCFPRVLTIAGYAHHKGIHDYIDAVARLLPKFPKISYQIVGNSRNKPYTQFLQRRIEELKLTDHVTLLRDASDAVKHAATAAADLYAQPSHEEGFCLAFAEAAMVVPRLIGCRTGEIAGLAAGESTARVVSPKDVDALVAATSELMAMNVSAEDVADRVRRLEERYSWGAYLDRHSSVSRAMLSA
jgi:glycosyltransferase involved in cell wall biosynthesis